MSFFIVVTAEVIDLSRTPAILPVGNTEDVPENHLEHIEGGDAMVVAASASTPAYIGSQQADQQPITRELVERSI